MRGIINKKLKFLYLEKKMTPQKIEKLVHQIGNYDGNTRSTIWKRLRKMGISRNLSQSHLLIGEQKRKMFKKELEDKELVFLYLIKRLTPELIREKTNCKQSRITIYKRLRELGVCRNKSDVMKLSFKTGRRKINFQGFFNYQYKSDLKHSVLSKWEANICRWLKFIKIKYQYEPKIFRMKIKNRITKYRPDIYIPKFNLWIEIKGWEKEFSMLKIRKFSETHTILVINKRIYKIIKEIFKDKIKKWE